jgi:hypothetical protein
LLLGYKAIIYVIYVVCTHVRTAVQSSGYTATIFPQEIHLGSISVAIREDVSACAAAASPAASPAAAN